MDRGFRKPKPRKPVDHIQIFQIIDAELQRSGAQPARNVKKEKFLPAPKMLERRTERKQRKHIEKYMQNVAVHEHVCQDLPVFERVRIDIVQRQQTIGLWHRQRTDEKNNIYNQQLFYNRCDIHHRANFLSISSTRMVMKVGFPNGETSGSLQANKPSSRLSCSFS